MTSEGIRKMKIVVTGANGQLGHEIMRQSRGSDHTFVFTDVCPGQVDIYGDVYDVVRMDIADKSEVAGVVTSDVDVVINCAAYTDVNGAETFRELASRINAEGPAVLAEAAAKADALLVQISTDYVFDGYSSIPYSEECEASPLNFYGKTKLDGENAIISSGCRYMIFRTSWMYSNFGKNFFLTMESLTSSKPELKVVCDQTGTPTSAYDLAFHLHYILDEDMLDKTGVYNFSNEGTCSWYDFAKEINDLFGYTCNVLPCRTEDFPSPAARPAYSVLDKTKVKETFGIEIPHWRDSLRFIVQEFLERYE